MGSSGMSLKRKLLLPNILYLILLAVVGYIFFDSSTMITSLGHDQRTSADQARLIRGLAQGVKDYVHGSATIAQVEELGQKAQAGLADETLSQRLTQELQEVRKYHALAQKNAEIEAEIEALTNASTKQSNGYIKMVAEKLADEQTRAQVSKLERLVIIGANLNTTANYEIKVGFQKLKSDIGRKESLLGFLETLMANVKKDVEALSKTPFKEMPKAALAANQRIKGLVLAFIDNTAAQTKIEAQILTEIAALVKEIDDHSRRAGQSFLGRMSGYLQTILIVILVAVVLGIGFGFYISGSVTRRLGHLVGGLNDSSDQVSLSAQQVSGTGQNLAEGASQQAASLEEAGSSLEEMSSMTRTNSENSGQADALMTEASGMVEEAGRAMTELAGAMAEIAESGDEIGKIVKSIDEIAFQTNLLALNAAVEAARAGEAGAGFAVVADEVRALALRAAEAAKSTQTLIEGTSGRIEQGNQLVEKTSDAFNRQSELAQKVALLISEVASASAEQAQGIDQINTSVAQMEQVVQGTAASAEESAAAAQELNSQATSMKTLVDDLKGLIGLG